MAYNISNMNGTSDNKKDIRTWVEISAAAVKHNVKLMRSILAPKTALWAVVKSNAYGHGIFVMPQLLDAVGVDGFCVDTLMEGVRLREAGIKKPILVLGLTLPNLLGLAAESNIAITISNFEILDAYLKLKNPPKFHLKLDTGMHRQGFYVADLPEVIKFLTSRPHTLNPNLVGVYTHFASAKDLNYPAYTEMQFAEYQKGIAILKKAGFKNFMQHVAATGGALINKKYHLNAVRCGIGLYGLWPSKELEMQIPELGFRPVLSWHAVIGEVKNIKKGDYVGYDLVERAIRDSRAAILPVGYWHGFPRSLSGVGEVLIGSKRCRVLGRVSMDMIAVDVGGTICKFGDMATLIGFQKNNNVSAGDVARLAGTSHYEIIARINPLIERVVV